MTPDVNWPISDAQDITLWMMEDEEDSADPIGEILDEVGSLLGAFDHLD